MWILPRASPGGGGTVPDSLAAVRSLAQPSPLGYTMLLESFFRMMNGRLPAKFVSAPGFPQSLVNPPKHPFPCLLSPKSPWAPNNPETSSSNFRGCPGSVDKRRLVSALSIGNTNAFECLPPASFRSAAQAPGKLADVRARQPGPGLRRECHFFRHSRARASWVTKVSCKCSQHSWRLPQGASERAVGGGFTIRIFQGWTSPLQLAPRLRFTLKLAAYQRPAWPWSAAWAHDAAAQGAPIASL